MDSDNTLEHIRSRINGLSKMHHVDILRILKQDPNITINENKSGVYINLSFLPQIIIDEIIQYIEHIDNQENSLNLLEKQKESFKNSFFGDKSNLDKDNKDDVLYYSNNQSRDLVK